MINCVVRLIASAAASGGWRAKGSATGKVTGNGSDVLGDDYRRVNLGKSDRRVIFMRNRMK